MFFDKNIQEWISRSWTLVARICPLSQQFGDLSKCNVHTTQLWGVRHLFPWLAPRFLLGISGTSSGHTITQKPCTLEALNTVASTLTTQLIAVEADMGWGVGWTWDLWRYSGVTPIVMNNWTTAPQRSFVTKARRFRNFCRKKTWTSTGDYRFLHIWCTAPSPACRATSAFRTLFTTFRASGELEFWLFAGGC